MSSLAPTCGYGHVHDIGLVLRALGTVRSFMLEQLVHAGPTPTPDVVMDFAAFPPDVLEKVHIAHALVGEIGTDLRKTLTGACTCGPMDTTKAHFYAVVTALLTWGVEWVPSMDYSVSL